MTGLPGPDQGQQKRNPSANNPQPGGREGAGGINTSTVLSSLSSPPSSYLHWPNPNGSQGQQSPPSGHRTEWGRTEIVWRANRTYKV